MARVAVVGGGLAGFVAYLTLLRGGLDPDEIVVFGTDPDPAAAWRRRAAAIRQTHMRSESDGHCLPSSFPGLAVREARRRHSLVPLARSVCDRYHPTVPDFLEHVGGAAAAQRLGRAVGRVRIERIAPVGGGFELDGHGSFPHVLLATGHAGHSHAGGAARAIRAPCTRTSRTSTPTASASSAPGSPPRPSG